MVSNALVTPHTSDLTSGADPCPSPLHQEDQHVFIHG